MEHPFFRNHWNYHPQRPRYAPSTMEVPIHRRTVPVAPKVVSIPVRFVESKKSRSDSATKIQKVFRGFLVRKNAKKVSAIGGEVDEIERRLANEETVESIRIDGKERVKFGEMLMNLLFRLDSVKGVDPGIRNFRKAVIKKAIALQEKVDSIAAADETPEADTEAVGEKEIHVSSAADIPNTCDGKIETVDDCNELENFDRVESNLPSPSPPSSSSSSEVDLVPEISAAGDYLAELKVPGKEGVEEEDSKGRSEEDEQRRDVERMVAENKRMMEMMEQLFERSEIQTWMLCSLCHRVEQLEKAFVYETLRRKKKRSTAIVGTSEKCPKQINVRPFHDQLSCS